MAKRDELVRFGVAMEASLLRAFDTLVKRRESTRSEMLRDLARAEVTREEVASGVDAVATVTVVYDHHVRGLTEALNDLQHGLGGRVRSTLHVHLDEAYCLEVIVLQGRAAELRAFAEKVFATRGVKHGGIDLVAAGAASNGALHVHVHEHHHDHAHAHTHEPRGIEAPHTHAHPQEPAPAPARNRATPRRVRRPT